MESDKKDKFSENQNKILDAALSRFQHFGIGKTTMAEIADDVSMSTANLYRYFKNKEMIAVACSSRCLNVRTSRLLDIVEHSSMTADAKLVEFFNEILRYTYEQVSSNPRINELVNIIAEKYKEVVLQKNQSERELIKRIVQQGIDEGKFHVKDIERSTLAIHTSMHMFQLPLAMTIHKLDVMLELASVTTELLIQGLRKQ